MRRLLEGLTTGALAIAALAVAGSVVHREFFRNDKRNMIGSGTQPPPVFLDDWEELLSEGTFVGPMEAEVKVVVFSDLQCPFSRMFHSAFARAKEAYGERVTLVFIHYPIRSHQFAFAAARAAECAQREGRFEAFVELVFRRQDSLGIKEWLS